MKTIIEHNEILLRANRNLEAAVATQAGIIARQREALKPFAALDIEHLVQKPDEWPMYASNGKVITVGHVRKARQILGMEQS